MRYAVLSDIHSNLEALTAVLDAASAAAADEILCLGDIVGYGGDPAACLERLAAARAVMVGGNHDLACVGRCALEGFHRAAKAAVEWTRDRLSFTDLDALRRLPLTATAGPCTLVHGTLSHPERFDYLVDAAQAVDTLTLCRTPVCLVGHTHIPVIIEYDRSSHRLLRILAHPPELADVTWTEAPDQLRLLVNPGSVGQPRDGDPRASLALIDTATHRVAIQRVAYDIAAAQRKIRAAGLPEFLADRLAVGR